MRPIDRVKEALQKRQLNLGRPLPEAIRAMREDFEGIPEEYLEFLEAVGFGRLSGSLQVYSGLVFPEELLPPARAAELRGIVLFGDDYQGYLAGFVPSEGWRVVEVEPATGEAMPVSEGFGPYLLAKLAG